MENRRSFTLCLVGEKEEGKKVSEWKNYFLSILLFFHFLTILLSLNFFSFLPNIVLLCWDATITMPNSMLYLLYGMENPEWHERNIQPDFEAEKLIPSLLEHGSMCPISRLLINVCISADKGIGWPLQFHSDFRTHCPNPWVCNCKGRPKEHNLFK